MSWEKIENHLFDKYCVEGVDKELQRLFEEHDVEVGERIVNKFLEKINDFLHMEDITYYKEDIKQIAEQIIQKDETSSQKTTPPVYEIHKRIDGGFNLYTVFYDKNQVIEFVETAGKRIMSASGIIQMYDKIEKEGKCSRIWDLQYSDICRIPQKYICTNTELNIKQESSIDNEKEMEM